jgi:Transglutaminase-like superfamily
MTSTEPATLAFYAQPDIMTDPGRHASRFEALPDDIAGLAAVLHGLVVHEFWANAYGLTLSDDDRATVHLRRTEALLDGIIARDDRPLTVARDPEARLAGNCRSFTVLMVAMLRAKGIPARARCGFGMYFSDGFGEDHWVCEYWSGEKGRWVLVDAQVDEVQRAKLPIDFDLTDVPRDRFLVAGDAWALCRAGAANPDAFGLSGLGQGGDWWIAGNLMRDVAALNNRELLPWDVWGAMPVPGEEIDADLTALFDRLATLTAAPDEGLGELQALGRDDPRLAVPPQVRNVLRERDEPI